jgi:hypothetical protein
MPGRLAAHELDRRGPATEDFGQILDQRLIGGAIDQRAGDFYFQLAAQREADFVF